MDNLKILSIGAGAIGTYIGGSLALEGNKVVFLERPRKAAEIERLKLNIDGKWHSIEAPTFATSLTSALDHGPFDLALFATKSFDTRAAMDSFSPYSDQLPPFLCLQNGVENEAVLAEFLGTEKVIPATVTTAVSKPGPGEVIVEKLRGIGISSQHSLSPRIESVFNQAGLNPSLFDHPTAMKWSKLLTNLLVNASSAILGMPPKEVLAKKHLFDLEVEQLRETLMVMNALNLTVTNLPGTPVRLLTTAIRWMPATLLRPLFTKVVVGGRGDKMPSFYIDMQAGQKKSEVNFLNGAVVRFGKKMGVNTPVNRFLTETLLGMVSGKIPQDRYMHNPEKLLVDLKKGEA